MTCWDKGTARTALDLAHEARRGKGFVPARGLRAGSWLRYGFVPAPGLAPAGAFVPRPNYGFVPALGLVPADGLSCRPVACSIQAKQANRLKDLVDTWQMQRIGTKYEQRRGYR